MKNAIKTIKNTTIAMVMAAAVGCVTAPEPKDYTDFRNADPRSILVVPALNNSTSVEAAEFFVSTVSRPFAERGYYVFPAHMVRQVMGADGLNDAALVHSASADRFAQIFGCDSVLFISIERWDSQYVVINTTTTVSFDYVLKSCHTGEELWVHTQELAYSPDAGSSGNLLVDLVAQAVVSAIEKASPNYIPLTQMANSMAASTVGQGLPAGPYRAEEYQVDQETFPSATTAAAVEAGAEGS